MSKTLKTPSIDFGKTIMAKVKSNEISMKPRLYFIAGSLFAITGLVSFSIGAVFLINLTLFLLKKHGPMGQWKLQQLLTTFPLWIPFVAVVSIMLGIWILRKYDFSYKKSFWLIILGFIISIVLAAFVIEKLGLNDVWSRQSQMRRFYQQVEGQNPNFQRGSGQGRGQGRFNQQGQ